MVNRRLSQIRVIAAAGAAALLGATTLIGTAEATGIYRWVDADGTVHFGDRPPPDYPVEQIQIQAMPPTGSGPQVQDEVGEAASERPSDPEAITVPDRLPAAE